jgi:DNA-directed RNA polymerase specialized sigma24 family protein
MANARNRIGPGHGLVERQQSFLEVDEGAAEHVLPAKSARRRRQDSAAPVEVVEALRAETAKLAERLAGIEKLLAELHAAQLSAVPAKEYYTTVEAAKLLGKRPYTVREWCRLGRVRG